MKHYIEISLMESADFNLFGLWPKVFQQIHLGLVEMQNGQGRVPIGVSFPEYVTGKKYSVLGGKCRLFAKEENTLTQFDVAKWLACLSDYVHFTSIRPVPDKLQGYARYQRLQPKTNSERLARRYAKRHDMNFETALNSAIQLKGATDANYPQTFRYCDRSPPTITTPFIRLQSLSSGKTFCLWIKKTAMPQASCYLFSTYGLSVESTVPEF